MRTVVSGQWLVVSVGRVSGSDLVCTRHETSDGEIVAGGGGARLGMRVRFDWAAGGAIPGTAEATFGLARRA